MVYAPFVLFHADCAGCDDEIQEGQALVALERQWHIWCFKCADCGDVLHGEYMGKDGAPYCERDYQRLFGVKCAHCERFITGKVLQAGDNNHFHPTCARCTKCGDPFGDGEEMYMQGGAIWHPRCGPGPDSKVEEGALIEDQVRAAIANSEMHKFPLLAHRDEDNKQTFRRGAQLRSSPALKSDKR